MSATVRFFQKRINFVDGVYIFCVVCDHGLLYYFTSKFTYTKPAVAHVEDRDSRRTVLLDFVQY